MREADEPREPGGPSLGRAVERVGNLVELLTTIDRRLLEALDGLQEMRTTMAGVEPIGVEGERLVEDVQTRIAALDERLNRDLDDLKVTIMDKLGELNLGDFSRRFDRVYDAVLNIERATVHLDQAVMGGMEMLPDFVTKRLRSEGRKQAPGSAAVDPLVDRDPD